MITDPAWFYSSLAQTSAAIVGLIGAVLTARVMDHMTQIRLLHQELLGTIRGVLLNISGFQTELLNLRQHFKKEIKLDDESIARGSTDRMTENTMDFGYSSSGGGYVNASEHLKTMRSGLETTEILIPVFKDLKGGIGEKELEEYACGIENAAKKINAQQALNIALNHKARLIYLLAEIRKFKAMLIPKSFIAVIAVLFVIATFGILWPLTALPGLGNYLFSKTLMLGGFSLGLLGLFIYILYLFLELRRFGNLEWE